MQLRRKKYVARFSNVELLGSVAPRRPGWRRHLTFALLLIGLTVLSVGVARPAAAVRVPRDRATVMLDIDVSLSMEATDVLPVAAAGREEGRQAVRRPAAAAHQPRPGQLRAATRTCSSPPTLDREPVKKAIDGLQLAELHRDRRGDLQLRSTRSSVFAQATTAKGDKPPPARIVLLSDGSNTDGRTIAAAIAAAAQAKVQVSTIAFGTPNGTVTGTNGEQVPVPADNAALQPDRRSRPAARSTPRPRCRSCRPVYKDIGSQIGYTTEHRDICWRFLAVGLLFTLAAAGASMLWSGRLT